MLLDPWRPFPVLQSVLLCIAGLPAYADAVSNCNSNDTKQRLEGCSALLQTNLGTPERAIAYSRRSDAHLAAGNLSSAIADRIQARELQPANLAYLRRLSDLYILRSQLERTDTDRAISLTLAEKVDPANPAIFFARAINRVTSKELNPAIQDLKKALSLAPDDKLYATLLVKLLGLRGSVRTDGMDYNGAIEDFAEALRLEPNNPDLLISRARAFAGNKSMTQALQDYARAISLDPKRPEPYFFRAEIYYTLGSFQQALNDLDEILKRDSKNVDALMLRGLAREANDQRDQAITDYRALLRIEPSHKLAKASLDRLNAPGPSSSESRRREDREQSQAPTQQGLKEFAVTTDQLNVRAAPDPNSDVLAKLDKDSRGLFALGESKDYEDERWIKVRVGNQTGWVNDRFINPTVSPVSTFDDKLGHEFDGDSYRSPSVELQDQCLHACLMDDRCRAMEFNRSNKDCNLFKTVPTLIPNNNVDAAIKRLLPQ